MRRIILRVSLVVIALIALLIAWVICGHALSLFLDPLWTVTMEDRPIRELGIEDLSAGMIRINDDPFSTAGPDNQPSAIRMKLNDQGQLVVTLHSRTLELGRGSESSGKVRPISGETLRFRVSHSLVSWPTPFEMNFMTGMSPSWKRHLYYQLTWRKQNGGALEMTWRYEQWFYPGGSGWANGFMTHEGSTGLITATIGQ